VENVIGFVGYECEDIVLYLAKILSYFGKKIAVIDRTEQELLLETLELQDERVNTEREGQFFGIWISNQGTGKEEYDFIFYLFGYRLTHPKLYECGRLVMVTDGVPAHAALLKKVGEWDRKQYLVIRNLVPMKHSGQYLALLAENKQEYCEIPYSEKDLRMKYCLGAYDGGSIKRLSEEMKAALVTLLVFISPDYPERLVRNVMRKL